MAAIHVKSNLLLSSNNVVKDSTQKILTLIFYALAIASFCRTCMHLFDSDYLNQIFTISTLSDFATQYKVCSAALEGKNIYLLRGTEFLYAGFHASPWGCLLGNIFYGGFLPFDYAAIYFLTLSGIILLSTSYILYVKAREILPELKFFVLAGALTSNSFLGIALGNAGGMICGFIIIAWVLCDEHPIISGIFIAFAMVKPQTAVPFCIFLLFTKRFLPLLTGALIDLFAWAAVSFMTNTGIFTLLQNFLFLKASWGWGGIFTPILNNFMAAMSASMIFGIIFIYAICRLLPDNVPEFFKAYPAFMAPIFWCYDTGNEFYALIIPALICIWLMMILSGKIRLFYFMTARGLLYPITISNVLTKILGRSAFMGIKTFYTLFVIILGVIIFLRLRRIYNSEQYLSLP